MRITPTEHVDLVDERRFAIMGSSGHVIVVGGPRGLVDHAEWRLVQLETRWSRFRSSSELSRLNAANGEPVVVSADTVVLIEAMRLAYEATNGRFDASVHDTMDSLGYCSPWDDLDPPVRLGPARPAPGCVGFDVNPVDGVIALPAGVRLDPGGLGKGLAADLVVGELMAAGALGALVNVGGDLRVCGLGPDGGSWIVDLDSPHRGAAPVGRVELTDAGVATTTSVRRSWRLGDGTVVHHLIDPATGRSAERPWIQVSTVAATAWLAEVLAKQVFLDGTLSAEHAAALIVDVDGRTRSLGPDRWIEYAAA
jgi:thiamine biosynthesis lipoprotein